MFTSFSYKAGGGSVANHLSSLALIKVRSRNIDATGLQPCAWARIHYATGWWGATFGESVYSNHGSKNAYIKTKTLHWLLVCLHTWPAPHTQQRRTVGFGLRPTTAKYFVSFWRRAPALLPTVTKLPFLKPFKIRICLHLLIMKQELV